MKLAFADLTPKIRPTISGVKLAFADFAPAKRRLLGHEIETDAAKGSAGDIELDPAEVLLASARAAKSSGTAVGLYLDEYMHRVMPTLTP